MFSVSYQSKNKVKGIVDRKIKKIKVSLFKLSKLVLFFKRI